MVNNKFKQNKLALSVSMLVASSVGGLATPMAVAQEGAVEEVIITGLRGSLMRAQAMKQENTSIVEALSAEDIGKLPDTSIAESLSRLPGLSGERRDGRTSGLSVRGFREDYVGTMLNGREILGIGDNRGVEYDLYPSEIMANGIVIYKSPDASLMTQGIGGTVDLRTNRPLDADSFLSINGLFEQNDLESANDDFEDDGYRIAASYSDSFFDDTFGVSFTLASLESPSQEEQFRGWGYADSNVEPGNKVLGGHDSFARSGLLERDTVALILQSRPMENFTATLDLLYIDFQEEKVFRGMEEGGAEWGTGDYTVTNTEDGLVTSGVLDGGFGTVLRNDAERKEAELKTAGLLLEYEFTEKWSGKMDFGWGETDKTISNIESYSGAGRPNVAAVAPANTVRGWTQTSEGALYNTISAPIDYTDFDQVLLAGPQSWGGGLVNFPDFQADPDNLPGVGAVQAQDGFINEPRFDEELTSFRLEATRMFESDFFDKINFGFIYSDRTKEKINEGFYTTAPTFPNHGLVPEQYRVGVTSLGFIGIDGLVAYDTLGMIDDGFYIETAASQFEADRLGDTYTIDETLETYFVKVDILAALSDVEVRGNIGAQYIRTEQGSDGFASQGIGAGFECTGVLPGSGGEIGTFTTTFAGEVCATAVSFSEEYEKVLPSLNLSFDFGDGHTVRTAISKTISRPRLDDMRASSSIRFVFDVDALKAGDPNRSVWSSTGGNPALKPLEANQFDLAYEWYYAADAFFSVAFFYKDLVNWHRNVEEFIDFRDAFVPGFHQITDRDGTTIIVPTTDDQFTGKFSTTADGLTGFVRGWEYQVTFPFHLVSETLDGLGMVFGYSNSDGLLSDGFRVPGLSDETFQFTAFYELGGFEARISGRKRSDFATETRGGSLALVPTNDEGSELWDAQIAYDFGKAGFDNWLGGLSVSLQGQNLTDEDTIQTEADDGRQILKYQTFGANYLLGFRYKF